MNDPYMWLLNFYEEALLCFVSGRRRTL